MNGITEAAESVSGITDAGRAPMELVVKFFELVCAFLRDLVEDGWTEEDVKTLRARRAEVLAFLRKGTTPEQERGMSAEAQLKRWVILYREVFSIELDIASIKVPPERRGFKRLIVVAQGMTPAVIFSAMKRLFPSWKWCDDLDREVTSIRSAKDGSYAVWCRDRPEADKENWSKPASAFTQEECLTLEECQLFGIAYKRETGRHLNEKSLTICAGSRDRGGYVPGVDRDDDGDVRVLWYHADYSDSADAVRSAVA
ncbi:MAG: hypothetical protein Q8Q32_03615 [bacterium]|nr:hypothetical protein [bacterium]